MQSVRDIAVEYSQQVEELLERLGARGPVRGAGELLDQVKHLLDLRGLRAVRRFLKLRNKVIHGKPVEMPMPSREEVERAGRAAVAVLEGALTAQARQANATFRPASGKGFEEPPGPVYRIRERDGAYEIWVGPGGVWVAAETREALEQARLDAEVRLVTRFPGLTVRGALGCTGVSRTRWGSFLRMRRETLEARVRHGRRRLSPEETLEAVRILSHSERASPIHQKARSSNGAKGQEHRMRQVKAKDIPATFYVGPVGVLAVAEHPFIAQTEARRVWEDSGGAISALPVVLDSRLKEPQGRVGGVLALRDEGAIQDYLRGKRLLDNDEVDLVAGWLGNRQAPVPPIREKKGRYRLKGEEVTEGRTKAPTAFVVELVPPSAPPAPSRVDDPLSGRAAPVHRVVAVAKGLSWRAAFLPELAVFALLALESPWAWFLVAGLSLRLFALFGDDPLGWKRRVLLGVGALELALAWLAWEVGRGEVHWMILVPGLLSLFRGIWLFWPRRKLTSPFRMSSPSRSRVP